MSAYSENIKENLSRLLVLCQSLLSVEMYRYLLHSQGKSYTILLRLFSGKSAVFDKSLPIIEELFKKTDINAKINIITEVPILVNPCDVFAHKEGNTFHAQLRSSIPTLKEVEAKNSNSWFKNWLKKQTPKAIEQKVSFAERGCMQIIISSDQKNIDVILCKKNCSSNAFCEIIVPISANLMIDAFDQVSINSLHSKDLVVTSAGNISMSNVRCQRDVYLCSTNGAILCKNKLMGKTIQISTAKKHPITLDVVTGGQLSVLTEEGNITTSSVYAMKSRFESKTGHLQLKNIHKQCHIVMHGKGAIQMEGTRAEINIFAADSPLELQLAYVYGHSNINCKEAAVSIGISDKVEKNVDLDICTAALKLDSSLKSLEKFISEDKTKLEHKIRHNNRDKLTIRGQCTILLFQQLWINNLVKQVESGNNHLLNKNI